MCPHLFCRGVESQGHVTLHCAPFSIQRHVVTLLYYLLAGYPASPGRKGVREGGGGSRGREGGEGGREGREWRAEEGGRKEGRE